MTEDPRARIIWLLRNGHIWNIRSKAPICKIIDRSVSPWTPELNDELRRLFDLGLTAKSITIKLNEVMFSSEVTLKAVESKVRRLKQKLSGVAPPTRVRKRSLRVPPPYELKTKSNIGTPNGVPMLDHVHGQCRWPIDEIQREPPFLTYCGHNVVKGLQYCQEHVDKMFSRNWTPRGNETWLSKKFMQN